MDFLAENKFVRDEALTKEYCRRVWYKGAAGVCCYVAMAFFLAAFVISLFGDYVAWYFVVGAAILPLFQWFGYRSQVKTMLQQGSLLNGGGFSVAHVGITQNGIVDISPDIARNIEIPFSKVKRVKQTKHLLLLYTEGSLCFLLHKYSFNKGTYQDFLNFLAQKGIK